MTYHNINTKQKNNIEVGFKIQSNKNEIFLYDVNLPAFSYLSPLFHFQCL